MVMIRLDREIRFQGVTGILPVGLEHGQDAHALELENDYNVSN
jgi:hypothetical protein